jgi:hypothetical protein
MKAMLEPRIVAARIHTLDSGVHGTAVSADRMTASSHGILIEVWMLLRSPAIAKPTARVLPSLAAPSLRPVASISGIDTK